MSQTEGIKLEESSTSTVYKLNAQDKALLVYFLVSI